MQRIEVVLVGWEHECCGPARVVGQNFSMRVFRGDRSAVYEIRHDYPGNPGASAPVGITGRLVTIELRPQILGPRGDHPKAVIGYRPGELFESTKAAEDAIGTDLTDFAFAFTIQTDDPCRTDITGGL